MARAATIIRTAAPANSIVSEEDGVVLATEFTEFDEDEEEIVDEDEKEMVNEDKEESKVTSLVG